MKMLPLPAAGASASAAADPTTAVNAWPGVDGARRRHRRLRAWTLAMGALALVACNSGSDSPSDEAGEGRARIAAAHQQRPNILVIVADDLGYSDLGAFGGEIATPHLDALAGEGRVLTNYQVGAFCSPTRAMLMSGADHHRVGLGTLAEITTTLIAAKNAPFGVDFGYDNVPAGYVGHLNDNALSMAELLRDAGYHTYMAGKWHLAYEFATPTPARPAALRFRPAAYPQAKGFERSYALLNGAGAHFAPRPGKPTRYDATTYTEDDVAFPASALPADFFSTKTFTDKLIAYIDSNRADGKPFFAYAAYTAPHWPLQAPDADIAAQRGKYDEGYEVIRERRIQRMKALGIVPAGFVDNPGLASVAQGGLGKKRWAELSTDEKAVQARAMEVYAAMVSNMDAHIGRLIQHLKDTGAYDNTLIFFMSDNGADDGSAMFPADPWADNSLANIGRVGSTVSYGERWAEVGSAPFRLWKSHAGAEGATSAPAVVKMPRQPKGQSPIAALVHVTDLLPTVLDLAAIPLPGSQYAGRSVHPATGVSLRTELQKYGTVKQVRPAGSVFAGELLGMRYVTKDNWKISLVIPPGEEPASFADVPWRLFDLATDRGETLDLAASRPEKVAELLAEWDAYVANNGVLLTLAPRPAGRDEAAP
jgi:arylsulfatase A-like enzyme